MYLFAMLAVILTGAPLAHAMVERGQPVSALFLCFLLLLTGSACWRAWRAIRDRQQPGRYFGALYWVLAIAVGAGGAGMLWLGLQSGAVLLQAFGGLGLFLTYAAVQGWRRAPQDPRWWLKEHYGNIIGCGVATHIAFLGIGLRRLLPMVDGAALTLIAWLAPLAVAAVVGWRLDRRYAQRPRTAAVNRPARAVPAA